ncbi:hypothetical protein LSAT2_000619 [Lamellibrachia satsuma]|nr:hypothetical protein LSAT2_000619 [Lamellibrachia satsuma]
MMQGREGALNEARVSGPNIEVRRRSLSIPTTCNYLTPLKKMRPTILLQWLLLAALVALSVQQKVTFQERIEAKIYCTNKFLRCFRLNRCQEKKFKYRKKICDKIYVECVNFAKSMFDKINANDFIRQYH